MNKEELEKKAEDWLNKWELCNKCENKVDCISNFSYCEKVVLQSYLAGAESREKHIAELEKNSKLKKQQLTIAKDLLLRFIELKNKPCASGHSVNMLLYENICADVKQFLNEVEK
jgi:hypothetical protein